MNPYSVIPICKSEASVLTHGKSFKYRICNGARACSGTTHGRSIENFDVRYVKEVLIRDISRITVSFPASCATRYPLFPQTANFLAVATTVWKTVSRASMQLHLYGARARRAGHCKIAIAFRREVNFLALLERRRRKGVGREDSQAGGRRRYSEKLHACTARMLRHRNRDGDITASAT